MFALMLFSGAVATVRKTILMYLVIALTDSTIVGAGRIGGRGLVLDNESCGTIDANVCGHTLIIDTGQTVTNAGTLEATNGGTLRLDDSVDNSGRVAASCGSILDITASAITWTGGTAAAGVNGIVLDNATLLVDSSSLTLDGGGAVALDCGTIAAACAGDTLHNADTLSGTGIIGCGGLVLNNEAGGTIDANVACGILILDTGCVAITNDGRSPKQPAGVRWIFAVPSTTRAARSRPMEPAPLSSSRA